MPRYIAHVFYRPSFAMVQEAEAALVAKHEKAAKGGLRAAMLLPL